MAFYLDVTGTVPMVADQSYVQGIGWLHRINERLPSRIGRVPGALRSSTELPGLRYRHWCRDAHLDAELI